MRDDLIGGLRNALERGFTIDQAIKSFTNAGYQESDVKEAAQHLDTGVTTMMQSSEMQISKPQPVKIAIQPLQQSRPKPIQVNMQRQQPSSEVEFRVPRQRPSIIIILLVTVLLLSVAGFIASLLFKQQIASFLS